MQSRPFSREEKKNLLPPKKDQGLRRAHSDISLGTDNINKDLNEDISTNEVAMVECACCEMSEDCTPTYISRIKEIFCGKWVCGLCSEAVKELVKRTPALTLEEAMESHTALCKKFKNTTRLNPQLSLASAMRDIARKSSERRTSADSNASKISRTVSCHAVFGAKFKRPPIQ